jgi:hypothetical protein
MKNKMVRFILIFILSIGSLIALKNSTQAKTYKLYDTDLIDTYASFQTNVLRISFSYINRKESQKVYWEKKSVDCSCVVYGIGKNATGDNEPPIIASKREFLKSYDQKIYIDIPENISQIYRKGIVQCDMVVGWETYQTKDEFYF